MWNSIQTQEPRFVPMSLGVDVRTFHVLELCHWSSMGRVPKQHQSLDCMGRVPKHIAWMVVLKFPNTLLKWVTTFSLDMIVNNASTNRTSLWFDFLLTYPVLCCLCNFLHMPITLLVRWCEEVAHNSMMSKICIHVSQGSLRVTK